jgi:hypothetical protein
VNALRKHRAATTSRPRRFHGDDGAVVVEAAFVLPVVVLVCFGIIEFGFVFRDSQTLTAATRTGARVGATLARQPYLSSVQDAVKGALTNNLSSASIQYLTIYKVANSAGAPVGGSFEGCMTDCARYTWDGTNWVFDGGTPWDYNAQKACGSLNHTDFIGVYVRIKHDMFTALMGSSVQIKDSTVMRLEPVVVGVAVTACE